MKHISLRACSLFLAMLPMHGQVIAQLRSANGYPQGQFIGPTAPGGGVVEGHHFWGCDGLQSFIRYDSADPTNPDPVNTGILVTSSVPFTLSTIMTRCAQVAFDGNQTVFIADPENRKGAGGLARVGGVKRLVFNLTNDTLTLSEQQAIASTAGLDGDNPTAIALGPDGNVYVGFLKNGNVKRIVSPYAGTTQAVQSVGGAPNGRAMRAMTFVGSDLYLASSDSLSVIHNAVSAACQGGCNAVTLADGFTGTGHVGLTTDGIDKLYMAVNNQVWRYSISSGLSTLVSSGAVDPFGVSLSYVFQAGKTNLLQLDRLGNLWIGDDLSDGVLNFQGRIFYISAGALATIQ